MTAFKKKSFIKSRKIDTANQYKPVIQRREEKTKQNNMQKMKLSPSEHML